MASIETAKLNGSWNALNLSDNLILPPELIEFFKGDDTAKANFNNFPTGTQRNTLQRIYDAKTETTRLKRIDQTFKAAKQNIR